MLHRLVKYQILYFKIIKRTNRLRLQTLGCIINDIFHKFILRCYIKLVHNISIHNYAKKLKIFI